MFYSEALLQRTGPLGNVWLAANLERKLSKKDALESNIDNNVRAIMSTNAAPMALRLSGQLLLGVVRIHSKKTKYLFEDCTAALARLKLASRPGDVDMPAHQSLSGNSHALTLPDAITEQDLFALPDPEDLFGTGRGLDIETSQLMPEITSTPTSQRYSRPALGLEEEDLGLDFNFDEPSIEQGRGEKSVLNDETTMLQEDLGLFGDMDYTVMPQNDNVPMAEVNDDHSLARNDRDSTAPPAQREVSFREEAVEEIDETAVQAAQRVKRRKVLRQDVETEIPSAQMKKLQEDQSTITRAPSYLPQDPFLLQLLEAQRSGAFVSNILGDGRMLGMAPELRGVCSIEFIRKAGEKKRKRDSGIADVESSSEKNQPSPQLDIPIDDDFINIDGQAEFGDSMLDQGTGIMDEDAVARIAAQDIDESSNMDSGFDNTVAPLLHPSQSGPVSVGTKSAVATLRQHLAPGHEGTEPPTPSKRTKAEAKFSELCPVADTSREAATKMFFELLVLGTKDAVKIEQEKKAGIDGEIRVRGKRGLWGSWAEMSMSSQQAVMTTL